jgi:hypothetical protein
MTPETVNTIGLSEYGWCDYRVFYVFPQPSHEESVEIAVDDETRFTDGTTARERTEQIEWQKRKYSCLSRLGLSLMFIGFLLQLVATWIPRAG